MGPDEMAAEIALMPKGPRKNAARKILALIRQADRLDAQTRPLRSKRA